MPPLLVVPPEFELPPVVLPPAVLVVPPEFALPPLLLPPLLAPPWLVPPAAAPPELAPPELAPPDDAPPAADGGRPGGLREDGSTFEHDPMARRETLELVRAYYRIADPAIRRRLFELTKAIAGAGTPLPADE